VKGLGRNVIEIRPHRIVYAKSLTFRTFLDIQPRNDVLSISIRKDKSGPVITYVIRTKEEIEVTKSKIKEAYEKIK
jgi:hypothetical protein